jgi:uncharacterized protein with FMN-binding domain
MGSSKFMVFKFKDMVKTTVFAILGVILIAAAVYIFLGRVGGEEVYRPGTYSSDVVLPDGNFTVEVKVGKNKIKSVSVINSSETISAFYPLVESTAEEVEEYVVKEQKTEPKEETQTPMTEKMLLEAVEKSLEKAKLNAGE